MENSAKIIWASPPSLTRDGIVPLLEQEPDFTFAQVVSQPEELANALAAETRVGLLIVDHLFLGNGQLLASLKEIAPSMKVLVIAGVSTRDGILGLMKSGADGYIVNEANKDELIFAIKHILAGNTYICTALYIQVLESLAVLDTEKKETALTLSEREEQILKLILEGYSNQEIAYRLFTNKRTIMKHREKLLQKTGAPDIGTVIRMALQQGVLS